MPKDDLVYVRHMLDLARQVKTRVRSVDRSVFDADENLRLATVHLIQTIGEAARLVSDEFRSRHPTIPWVKVTGMRHRIVHDYLNVDFDIVWQVASEHVPELIPQ